MARRHSLRKARRQLHTLLDSEGRELVMDWWSEAEERFTTHSGDPSWLTDFLANAYVFSELGEEPTGPEAYLMAIRAGYSLRTLLPGYAAPAPMDVSMIDAAALSTVASRPRENGIPALEPDDADVLVALSYLVIETVQERFGEVASVGPDFWDAVVSLATYKLQSNIQSLGLGKASAFDADTVDAFLRYGFVLRCLDEALGIEPSESGTS
jgi:hypothetical protein